MTSLARDGDLDPMPGVVNEAAQVPDPLREKKKE